MEQTDAAAEVGGIRTLKIPPTLLSCAVTGEHRFGTAEHINPRPVMAFVKERGGAFVFSQQRGPK